MEIKKEEVITALQTAKIYVARYDKNWRWFHNGDTQGTCPLLAFMIDVEYRSGTLVFIPDEINQTDLKDRNKENDLIREKI